MRSVSSSWRSKLNRAATVSPPTMITAGRIAIAPKMIGAAFAHRVPDEIERRLVDEVDQDRRAVDHHAQAESGEARRQRVAALLDLDGERPGPLGERTERRGPEKPAILDRHEVVADPLD